MSQSAPHLYRGKPCAPDVSTAYRVRVSAGARVTVPRGWVHLVVAPNHDVPSFMAWWARGSQREDHEPQTLRGAADYGQCDGSVVLNTPCRRVAGSKIVRLGHFLLLEIPGGERASASWRRDSSAFGSLFSSDLVADQCDQV
jgi:hypothetical protein